MTIVSTEGGGSGEGVAECNGLLMLFFLFVYICFYFGNTFMLPSSLLKACLAAFLNNSSSSN